MRIPNDLFVSKTYFDNDKTRYPTSASHNKSDGKVTVNVSGNISVRGIAIIAPKIS